MSAAYNPKVRERVAAGPRKGEEFGPCEPGACEHRDCRAAHDLAATACVRCGEPIGYGARYYSGPAHEVCELQAAEGGAA